ncbi:54S ribosomal protein L7, mitochondrial [Oleoguttula sp. CCFEE 5521]
MALQEVTASFLRRVRGQTGPLARAQRLQCQRYASTKSTSDTQELEETSFTQASPSTSKFPKYDPLARSRKYTGKLPPSRYQFRPPKYYRGPLHPHQPPPPSDPSSREFIPGPFSLPRLKQTYDSTTAPDLMTLAYVHHPPGYTAPKSPPDYDHGKAPRLTSPIVHCEDQEVEYGWQDIPQVERITVHTFVKDATSDSARLHVAGMVLQAITSVRATSHAVKKSLAGFNIRAGQYLSVTSDLKGESMHHFLSECIDVVMPKIKDWRGVKGSSGDGSENISFGFTAEEVALWPGVEVNYDMYPPKMIPGIHVTVHTTATTDYDARLLLGAMGIPFYGKFIN